MLINPLSYFRSLLVKGDVNGDKLEDIYIGGGMAKPGCFIYSAKEWYHLFKKQEPAFETDKPVKMLMDYFLMQMEMDLMICML